MKNNILITLFFCLISGFTKLHAQQPKCEFDTIYYHVPINFNSGKKVIQLNDNSFFIVGTSKIYDNTPPRYFYSTSFIRLGACGSIIWTFKDSVSVNYIADTRLIEEQDESITILVNGNRLIKLDKYGIKKWEVKVGDSTNYLSTYSFIKLSPNRYLFAGAKANQTSILLTDSLGNAILQKSYFINANANSYIQQVYKKSLNEINLIGFEGSSLFKLTIDTMGNLQNSNYTVVFNGSSPEKHACYNFDSNEILYSSLVLETYKIYLARYTLNGVKIKDSITNIDGPANTNVSYLSVAPNKAIELRALRNTILVDSDFNTIWKDTLLSTGYAYYSSIFTKENSVITVGDMVHCPGTPASCYWDLHVKKSFTYKYIKSLTISGQNYINTNTGQTQLTAIITPADALNQQINWSVNDTNKAIISQTGLLTAKANGTITIRATSADNSNATATKSITITNQLVYITSIVINGSDSINQNRGKIQLTTSIAPTDATNKKIKWSLNDTSLASIDSIGWITAKANGTIIVTAASADSSNISATKSISITNQLKYIQSIIIYGPNSITQNAGQIQLTTSIIPTDASIQKINWSVNLANLASIDTTGIVTAKANGTIIVTASASDGSNITATKNITITNQTNAINEMLPNLGVSVYPNPANQSINILFQSIVISPDFELFDAKGMLVKNAHFDKINEQLYNLNIKDLADGMYLLSVSSDQNKIYQKVMVVK
ncbi:MAG: Ig-like domain-containing protein [Bacteroidota bacterium]|nr:Ig-like domain-containing protein [Bacteroidota bacterium]